jgi:hypothetical protein
VRVLNTVTFWAGVGEIALSPSPLWQAVKLIATPNPNARIATLLNNLFIIGQLFIKFLNMILLSSNFSVFCA